MGYSTFTSLGMTEVLFGVRNLLCDGYLILPSSLFASLVIFTIPVAAGKMGLQALNGVGLALVGDYLIGLTFPMVASTVFQAYLSRAIQKDKWEAVRSTFQRTALIWTTLFFLIQVPLLCNWGLILRLAGQNQQLAHIAQIFIFIQLPRYFALYIANLCLMTMFAQDIVWPTLMANVLNFGLVVVAELLVAVFHADVYFLAAGVCAAQLLTTCVVLVLFLVKHAHHPDLVRFESNSFDDWSEMFSQSILSIAQHVAMRLVMEVGVIMGGLLSHVELGAATILRRYTAFASSIPLNLMAPVVCKSIGASIGKRSHVSVRVYICSGFLLIFVIGILLALVSVLFRRQMARLMTNEPAVVVIAEELTGIVSLLDCIMLLYMTNIFVFRGLRAMTFPTIMGFCLQNGFSVPLSVVLVFSKHMHLSGYYVALCVSFLLELLVDSGYLHLFKLPALLAAMKSYEQQQPSGAANGAPSVICVEIECSKRSRKCRRASRVFQLIWAALFINCIAIAICVTTNTV